MTAAAIPLTAHRPHRSGLSIGIAVAAFAGVPAIWLPFARDITPASALFEHGFLRLWPLAWPHLLAIPIAAALVRWVASGRLSDPERWFARLVAAGAACVTASVYVGTLLEGNWPSDAGDWTTFVVPLAMLGGGAAVAVRALRRGQATGGLDAIVVMELAYLPNVACCVLTAMGWEERLQVGAFAVLLASIAYAIHVLSVVAARPPARAS